MNADNFAKLASLVNDAVAKYGTRPVASAINNAHNGRLDGFIVTSDNLHLFRQYRNSVSGNAAKLLRDAKLTTK